MVLQWWKKSKELNRKYYFSKFMITFLIWIFFNFFSFVYSTVV